MGYALKNDQTFDDTSCCACGIVFYVPDFWLKMKRADRTAFYCPNGHPLSYTESEVDLLKKTLAEKDRLIERKGGEAEFERARANSLDRRLKQEVGKHRALKARVKAGVCPCCHRTFKQLAEHMQSQHPGYTSSDDGAEKVG